VFMMSWTRLWENRWRTVKGKYEEMEARLRAMREHPWRFPVISNIADVNSQIIDVHKFLESDEYKGEFGGFTTVHQGRNLISSYLTSLNRLKSNEMYEVKGTIRGQGKRTLVTFEKTETHLIYFEKQGQILHEEVQALLTAQDQWKHLKVSE
jgi:hypothetical protein